MKRVLFISYAFPPVGGAGVQRVTKFVKYLPKFGWAASVLTVRNPSVPLIDKSLLKDVPEETIVLRAPTFEPGYRMKAAVSAGADDSKRAGGGSWAKKAVRGAANFVLQPDPQILWAPAAIKMAIALLRKTPHSAIIASGPPFSALLIGAALNRLTGVPLILDYRDEWGISNAYSENKQPPMCSVRLQNMMQRKAVKRAAVLLATTRTSARSLEAIKEASGSKGTVDWIYNGFDPEDFREISSVQAEAVPSENDKHRLVYVGTLWNLTDVSPLVAGVRRLCSQRPDLGSRLELAFIGRRTGSQEALLSQLDQLPCKVIREPYLDHDEIASVLKSADGCCVLLADAPGAERVMPAKVFEYIAARRPILAVAPPGELWDLLANYPGAHLVRPTDSAAVANEIATMMEDPHRKSEQQLANWDSSSYGRDSQAMRLAQILDSVSTAN